MFSYEDYQQTAQEIKERISVTPKLALILGSGLGPLADSVENATIINNNELSNWPQSTVEGHHGRLVIGHLEGHPIFCMQGRVHYYEGYTMEQVTFPIRVMQALGVETLIVTNAAGGINTSFAAGDLMLIEDHINLLGHMGQNALIGPNDDRLGDRFPIFTVAYDQGLRRLAIKVGREQKQRLQRGVYLSLSGPAFETPAEIRMFRAWGADAVGMSTAPEVTVARHAGIRVLGISSITNVSIDHQDIDRHVSHEDVISVGATIVPDLMRLLRGILQELPVAV